MQNDQTRVDESSLKKKKSRKTILKDKENHYKAIVGQRDSDEIINSDQWIRIENTNQAHFLWLHGVLV